jgi:hypothetical protein
MALMDHLRGIETGGRFRARHVSGLAPFYPHRGGRAVPGRPPLRSRRKPLLRKSVSVGGALAPNLCLRWRKGSRLKPLLRKSVFVGGALAPNFQVFDGARFATEAAPATPSFWFSMAQRSRLKPLLRKSVFVGGALAPNFQVFDDARVAMKAAPATPSFWLSMAQRVAAEAAPTASIFLAVAPLVPAGQPQAVDLHQNLRIIGGEEPIVQDFNLRLQARQASPAKMGGWRYRWRQFRWALGARIREEDRALVARFLPPEAQALFRRMPRGDQRHSLAVLRTLLEWGGDAPGAVAGGVASRCGESRRAPLSLGAGPAGADGGPVPALLATDPPAAPVAPPLGRAGPAVSGPSEDRGGLGSGGRVRPPHGGIDPASPGASRPSPAGGGSGDPSAPPVAGSGWTELRAVPKGPGRGQRNPGDGALG